MAEVIIPIAGIVGTFGSFIIFVYLFFSSRHKQRMALIEAGKDASIFRTRNNPQSTLKYGIVAIMVGIGLFTASVLEGLGMPGVVAYFSMILIFGGAGLVLFYAYFEKPNSVKEKEREAEEEFI